MSTPTQLRDLFQRFVPLVSLPPSEVAQLLRYTRLVRRGAGQQLFRRGELAATSCWLVSGRVEIDAGQGPSELHAGSEAARHPLAPGAQRSASVRCIDDCELLHIDRERLDLALTWSQGSAIEVRELEAGSEDDWIVALLQRPAFQRLPAANLAQLLAAMEPQRASDGEDIIRQGEPGDHYYVIAEGRCVVLREHGGVQRQLAELGVGQGFGEEALLSGQPRNATVRAVGAVQLMRLSRADFSRLLQVPLLRGIELSELPPGAALLDVRLPDEFIHGHLPTAINLPLAQLRDAAAALHRDRLYVVYCDTGRRSAAACFLLAERGVDARFIVNGVPAQALVERF